MNLLEILSFGPFYTEIALLLRESLFINGILYNAEVWYGLSKTDIKKTGRFRSTSFEKNSQGSYFNTKRSIILRAGYNTYRNYYQGQKNQLFLLFIKSRQK